MTGQAPAPAGHVNVTIPFGTAAFGHAWRDPSGDPRASVQFGQSWVTFDSAAAAREAAAACAQAAGAMEALPPPGTGVTP